MRHFTLPVLSLALLLALFGCTQGGIPAACANSTMSTIANCVYTNAVLEQNPYDCYSLNNSVQKEKCLRDSSDSSAKKLLEQMTPEERAKVFAAISGAIDAYGINGTNAISIVGGQPDSGTEPEAATVNPPAGVSEADSQAYTQAVAANNMAQCTTIGDTSTRSSCIVQVAQQVKAPDVCAPLSGSADFDLCNMYAKAG
ncbi:MAG: hypothetical protein WCY41_02660 [Candidatus Micrarchaeia archaeon]